MILETDDKDKENKVTCEEAVKEMSGRDVEEDVCNMDHEAMTVGTHQDVSVGNKS